MMENEELGVESVNREGVESPIGVATSVPKPMGSFFGKALAKATEMIPFTISITGTIGKNEQGAVQGMQKILIYAKRLDTKEERLALQFTLEEKKTKEGVQAHIARVLQACLCKHDGTQDFGEMAQAVFDRSNPIDLHKGYVEACVINGVEALALPFA